MDTSPTDPTPPAPPPSAPADPAPVGPPTPPTPPTPPDAGPDGPPSPQCTPEAEPNNELSAATTFTTSLCGKIDSHGDVDFGRFVVPAGAKNLAITHSESGGKVSYRYYLNGQLLPLSAEINATPGAVYGVQMRLGAGSNAGDRPSYELTVSFD